MLKELIVRFDAGVMGSVQHWPGWLFMPMTVITTIGNPITLSIAAGLALVLAWQQSNMRLSIVMLTALAAMTANSILKHFVHRPRPDTLYVSHMWFATSSFPSGHTFGSTVVLGLFAFLAAYYLHGVWQIIVPVLLGLLIIGVGVSRVYLGAHYPSDVVAGWLLGALVLTVCIVAFFKL